MKIEAAHLAPRKYLSEFEDLRLETEDQHRRKENEKKENRETDRQTNKKMRIVTTPQSSQVVFVCGVTNPPNYVIKLRGFPAHVVLWMA